ncbi:serine/threonine protein kinase ppk15, putative [Entamoeba invadens IP1]|uniref:Serine/threonine protein kinase ppk15, putative n=1 Tax=Entamoeba invadens IP1 TaxID=370355 RepID=A0A0A1U8V5_ENTIV|nr:serine/threonine protein kinase ppk15, putative [Entamoeba invadens IP1]ELP91350.1 serine/threonine protein kinase ppk15, putative [Entamoeba invadens IP1]|eukprot:XP_004258121.1 serine/threonine protein kinase ppk15, putative [Entamoeba invadens IP1]
MASAFKNYQPYEPLIPRTSTTLVRFLTTRINETYRVCDKKPQINGENSLTDPFESCHNYGLDNEKNELIVYRGMTLGTFNSFEGMLFSMDKDVCTKYKVIDRLGHGTFGQVFKCWDIKNEKFVAVKILKNKKAYLRQGLLECAALTMLNTYFDSGCERIVKMYDHFMFCDHLCIVFELLDKNLYQYCKLHRNSGIKLQTIQQMMTELLESVSSCCESGIIHCDVKPENILMGENGELKLIDLGSACFENYTLYTYIQSRHYRAPEIVFNMKYTNAIDMWSVGCIIAEMFLGVPLFPASSEYDLIARFVETVGMPSDDFLLTGKTSMKFFKEVKRTGKFRLKESFEYEWENNVRLPPHKNYLYYAKLSDIIMKNPMKLNLDIKENNVAIRECLLDLLKRLLVYDPSSRLTPGQALAHPFFTSQNISEVTQSDLANWVPPEREFPFKIYGHSVSSFPTDMMNDAFAGEIVIDKKLSNAEYYNIFFKLLQSGHVANVTIDNPFEYGSVTPRQFSSVFDPTTSAPLCTPRREVTPRKIALQQLPRSMSASTSSIQHKEESLIRPKLKTSVICVKKQDKEEKKDPEQSA